MAQHIIEVVPAGPGFAIVDSGSLSADVALEVVEVDGEGSTPTVATLILSLTNVEGDRLPRSFEVGIEVTRADIVALRDRLQEWA